MPHSEELAKLIEKLKRARQSLAEHGGSPELLALLDAAIAALQKMPFDAAAAAGALREFASAAGAGVTPLGSSYCIGICEANFKRDIQSGMGFDLAFSIYLVCLTVCHMFSGSTMIRPPERPTPPLPVPGPQPPIIYTPAPVVPHGAGPCRVTVTLLRVTHSGGDEGVDWVVETCVQGLSTKFAPRKIYNNGTEAYGQVVYDGKIGNCGASFMLDLACSATELDITQANQVGSAARQETIVCGTQTLVSIPVTVDRAVMNFVLNIETRC